MDAEERIKDGNRKNRILTKIHIQRVFITGCGGTSAGCTQNKAQAQATGAAFDFGWAQQNRFTNAKSHQAGAKAKAKAKVEAKPKSAGLSAPDNSAG